MPALTLCHSVPFASTVGEAGADQASEDKLSPMSSQVAPPPHTILPPHAANLPYCYCPTGVLSLTSFPPSCHSLSPPCYCAVPCCSSKAPLPLVLPSGCCRHTSLPAIITQCPIAALPLCRSLLPPTATLSAVPRWPTIMMNRWSTTHSRPSSEGGRGSSWNWLWSWSWIRARTRDNGTP